MIGYGGTDCEDLLLCEQHGEPCDHGQCVRDGEIGQPMCVCEEGYEGPRCNRPIMTGECCSRIQSRILGEYRALILGYLENTKLGIHTHTHRSLSLVSLLKRWYMHNRTRWSLPMQLYTRVQRSSVWQQEKPMS